MMGTTLKWNCLATVVQPYLQHVDAQQDRQPNGKNYIKILNDSAEKLVLIDVLVTLNTQMVW